MRNLIKVLAFSVLIVFAFVSCAKQPAEQIDAAKAAIQGVIDAKGDIYAKEEVAKLQNDLQAAMDEINGQAKKFFKKFGNAKNMLAQVVTDATAVKELIPGRIAEAKAAAQTSLDEVKVACDEATALLEKAPKGKGTKADIEAMKADLAGLVNQLTDAQSAFAAEDYLGAKEKAAAIKEKADQIKEQVNAAIAKIRR